VIITTPDWAWSPITLMKKATPSHVHVSSVYPHACRGIFCSLSARPARRLSTKYSGGVAWKVLGGVAYLPWRQTPSRFDPGKVEALAPRATGSLVTRGTLQGLVHVRHEGLRRERIALGGGMPIVGEQVELVGAAARLPEGYGEIDSRDADVA